MQAMRIRMENQSPDRIELVSNQSRNLPKTEKGNHLRNQSAIVQTMWNRDIVQNMAKGRFQMNHNRKSLDRNNNNKITKLPPLMSPNSSGLTQQQRNTMLLYRDASVGSMGSMFTSERT